MLKLKKKKNGLYSTVPIWASWPSLFCFLGGRLHDQMVKINQNLHRLQVAWRDAQQSSSPAADNLREQFERLMTIYLSTKTAMTEPQMLQNCLNLQVSMAVLLVQLAIGNEGSQPIELTFPLPDGYSSLAYVPGKQALPWELPIYSHLSLTGSRWKFNPRNILP